MTRRHRDPEGGVIESWEIDIVWNGQVAAVMEELA